MHAGANRFVWNLRGPDATKLPDNKGRGGTTDALTAPRVPPGRYQIRLTAGGRTVRFPQGRLPRALVPVVALLDVRAYAA